MSERLKLSIITAIENTLIILAFTILSIFFKIWWIVLFSGLFLTTVTVTIKEKEDNEDE